MAAKTTTKKLSKDGKTLTISTDRRVTIIKHVAVDPKELLNLSQPGTIPVLAADELTLLRIADLARINCTNAEMAAALNVDLHYFEQFRHQNPIVSKTIESSKAGFKASLRRTQAQVAIEDKNVPMLIHLGKTVLGQSEKSEVNHNHTHNLLNDVMAYDAEASVVVLPDDDDDD